jgi:amidase
VTTAGSNWPPSALELAAQLRAGRVSAIEVIKTALEHMEGLTATLGAVAALDNQRSLGDAAESDRRLHEGSARPLEAVPITVKDWIDVEGWPVAGGTLDHRDRRPQADATAVARLRAAGAIVVSISRARADSWLHGQTRNPHDLSRAPGGSSSGAAALVGAGVVPLGLGSDSGGSIRLPASWCGVAGLKPTFGRVPLTGHFPVCGYLEDGRTVIGPIANTVADLAAVLALIAGADGVDAAMPPVALGDPAQVSIAGLQVGRCGDDATTRIACDAFAELGAEVSAEPLPDFRDEALEVTQRYWKRHKLSGRENLQLLTDWDQIRSRVAAATAGVDIVVTPATPGPAPPWRESEVADYQWQLVWSLTGSPAVVLPVGVQDGMPIAVQIVARPWADHVALAAAAAIEAQVRQASWARLRLGGIGRISKE